MSQIVADPDIDDPASWEIVGFGASVSGGQLKFVLSTAIRVAPIPEVVAIIGDRYVYRLDIASAVTGGLQARALFGGVEICKGRRRRI